MSTETKTFDLTFKGVDFWGQETYLSESGRYYKLVDGAIHTLGDPFDFDGEPDSPVKLKQGVTFNLINKPAKA